jgi:hypothetical protein
LAGLGAVRFRDLVELLVGAAGGDVGHEAEFAAAFDERLHGYAPTSAGVGEFVDCGPGARARPGEALMMTGIEPALSAWELACHARPDHEPPGQQQGDAWEEVLLAVIASAAPAKAGSSPRGGDIVPTPNPADPANEGSLFVRELDYLFDPGD